jgi:hypothetical protein
MASDVKIIKTIATTNTVYYRLSINRGHAASKGRMGVLVFPFDFDCCPTAMYTRSMIGSSKVYNARLFMRGLLLPVWVDWITIQ